MRTLIAAISLFVVFLAFMVAIEWAWFGPAREGMAFQQEFDKLIAEKGWDGQIIPVHYDRDVRILLNNVSEEDLQAIFPILHRISWLRSIIIDGPQLTETARERWRSEFPNCFFNFGIAQ